MRAWKCKQVIDFDKSTPAVKEERSRIYNNKRQISTIIFKMLHWCPIRSYSSDDLQGKIWSSASELRQTVLKGNCELQWIVNIDRQFCGTVYVISWTVALILSSRKIVNLENVFVSFQDFVGKTRNFSVWSLARFNREEGYTYHRKFGHKWNWIWNSVHWWIVSHQWRQNITFFEQWLIHGWEE